MNEQHPVSRVFVYVLRVWREATGLSRAGGEWRGEVRSVESDRVEYFHQLSGIVTAIEKLQEAEETQEEEPS